MCKITSLLSSASVSCLLPLLWDQKKSKKIRKNKNHMPCDLNTLLRTRPQFLTGSLCINTLIESARRENEIGTKLVIAAHFPSPKDVKFGLCFPAEKICFRGLKSLIWTETVLLSQTLQLYPAKLVSEIPKLAGLCSSRHPFASDVYLLYQSVNLVLGRKSFQVSETFTKQCPDMADN